MRESSKKKTNSNFDIRYLLVPFILPIIIIIAIAKNQYNNIPEGIELNQDWHEAIVEKVIDTDDIDVFFESGERVVLSNDIYRYDNENKTKVTITPKTTLYIKNKENKKDGSLYTYVCYTKIDYRECEIANLVIKTKFDAYTVTQGYVKKNI